MGAYQLCYRGVSALERAYRMVGGGGAYRGPLPHGLLHAIALEQFY